MANVDSPHGLIAVGHLLNGQYDGRGEKMFVAASHASNLFVGDVVKVDGTGEAGTGIPGCDIAAPGDTVVGVIVNIEVDKAVAATEHPGYLPASTAGYVYVNTDPYVIFEVQEDSDAGALAVTDIHSKASFIVGTGSTVTGKSAVELDSSSAGTGVDLTILGLARRTGNEVGNFAKWLVTLPKHTHNTV